MAHTDLDVGPIDYLAVGFDLDGDGVLDLGVFSGIESELLDDDDTAQG